MIFKTQASEPGIISKRLWTRAGILLCLAGFFGVSAHLGIADDAAPPPPPPPAAGDASPGSEPPPPAAGAAEQPPKADAPAVSPNAPVSQDSDAGAGAPSQADGLTQALEARNTGHFTGRPITIQVRGVEVTDVLRLISEASGFNIIVGDDVHGKMREGARAPGKEGGARGNPYRDQDLSGQLCRSERFSRYFD
jgi:hypothetical protein